MDTIKANIISYVFNSARPVRSENIELSQMISSWQNNKPKATSAELTNFIASLKYPKYSGAVIKVSYTSQAAQNVIDSKYLLPLSITYTQIGISIKFNAGFLEVYVGYVAW